LITFHRENVKGMGSAANGFSVVMSTFRFFVSEAFRFFGFDQKINKISFFLLSTNAAPAHKTFIYAFDHAQM
jgi:hypothetical protein